ncbi:MAG: sulfurtransferase TusA family protein [Armatimonadetes bacterium]|nr:sulfurtransferase TusA family protein [Armatimonadota bacterium]
MDCTELHCPQPVVETHRAIKTMKIGECLEVINGDCSFPSDLKAWCAMTKQSLLSIEAVSGIFHAYIEKVSDYR